MICVHAKRCIRSQPVHLKRICKLIIKKVNYGIIILSGFVLYGVMYVLNKVLPIDIPKPLFDLIVSSLATTCGAVYLLTEYPLNLSLKQFKKDDIKKIIIFGLVGGILIAVIQFPYKTIFLNHDITSKYFINTEKGKIYVAILFFFLIFITPIFEELLFRGGVYRVIKNRYNIFWGYLCTAILFAIMHTASIYQSILHMLSSLVLTYTYEKTNFIGTSILAHLLWNMIWIVAIYFYYAMMSP
jgi:membrane protease YdiL (CAAX protease family)